MQSLLKTADSGVMIGLAQGAAIYMIYQSSVPNLTDIRSAKPHDGDVESARKGAAWKSAGILGVIFLMTRDVNAFLIGGLTLAGIDYMVKHSNGVHPSTGKLADAGGAPATVGPASYPLPEYTGLDAMDMA